MNSENRACLAIATGQKNMERADGIEPTRPAWKAGVLPLNYARNEQPEKVAG